MGVRIYPEYKGRRARTFDCLGGCGRGGTADEETTSTRMRGQMTKIDGIKNSLRHLTQNAVDSYAVASPSAELMWDIPQAAAALPSYAQHIRAITFHSRTRIYNL